MMGSVVKVYKNKKHIGWQARIVRVGLPKFTLCFCTYDEAADWLNENEERFIHNHKSVIEEIDRLKKLRTRRKLRTGKV